MKEVLPGVLTWCIYNEDKGLNFNGHLVAGPEGRVMIDPPPPSASEMETLQQAGAPEAIIITNAHHTRDAVTLARHWKVPILAPRLDAALLPAHVKPDRLFDDGETLPGGLVAIALHAQKSPGETALLLERANAIILGDALIGKPPGRLSLLPDAKYADVKAARQGLKRILEHPFEAVLVGDGASLPKDGRRIVTELLEP